MDGARSSLAGRPGPPADSPGDHSGLLWAAGRPGHPARPSGRGDRRAGQARPRGPSAPGPARHWQAHGDDAGRRDRRHQPVPLGPQAVRLGWADPAGAQLRSQGPPWPHHQQGSPWVRWILQEAAQTAKRHPMFADTYGQLAHRRGRNIATVAVARRLLARSFHILTQLEAASISEKALPGALASLHEPATRPPGLTEQPGSGLYRHVDPTFRGPNGCMRANSATSSGPSPSDSAHDHHKPANPRSRRRAGPFTPLDTPDPMGAQTALRRTAWTETTSLRIWRLGVRIPRGPILPAQHGQAEEAYRVRSSPWQVHEVNRRQITRLG